MQKIFKKMWDCVTTILVMLVVCLAILLGAPRFLHIQPLVVLSGSMEPVFMTGSLVYVQETEVSSLEVGDVITFRQDDDTIVTHRIIEIVNSPETPEGVGYRTKGDANDMEDAYIVPPENVIGKAMFAIPYLGYLVQYIQQPPGLYIAIVVGAGLILLMFLPYLFAKEEKESDRKENIIKPDEIQEESKKKKRPLTEEEKREIIRRRKMKEAKERKMQEEKAQEHKVREHKAKGQKQSEKKKRPLTEEEKREIIRRRKMQEERKNELAEQKAKRKEIEDIEDID